MPTDLARRYYLDLACAFIRGRLPAEEATLALLTPDEVFHHGEQAGLRLHKFKRTSLLPRIRRAFGFLKQLAPETLLDVGSGRGVFLWPLLEHFPLLRVHCVDIRTDRVADLLAVACGGVERLSAGVLDIARADLPDRSFDGVTLLEVLEHLPTPVEALQAAARLARTFVLVSVPSKPDDNPEHIHLFDRQSLGELFSSAGVQRVTIEYVLNHILALGMVDPP